MKQCKKVLALVLALLMLMSSVSVLASAKVINNSLLYNDTTAGKGRLYGKMNAADTSDLNDAQYASAILDYLDKFLGNANIKPMTIKISSANVTINFSDLNGASGTLNTLGGVIENFSNVLGDVGPLGAVLKNCFTSNIVRKDTSEYSDTACESADVAYLQAVVSLLSNSTLDNVVYKLISGGLGTSNGVDLGSIGNTVLNNIAAAQQIKEIAADVVGYIKKTLFNDSNANFDKELATLIIDFIDNADIEFLEGFSISTDSNGYINDSVYGLIDKAVRCVVNWAVKQLKMQKTNPEESAFGNLKELVLSYLPTFETDFPFVKLDNIGDIDWSWSGIPAYSKGNTSSYLVYYINDMVGTIVNTVVPDFADSSNPNYTGGWTMNRTTNSLNVLDSNIQKAAEFVDNEINGGSLTAEEKAQSSNLTKTYAMVLANYVIGLFLPGLKVEKDDIIHGNIGTLAVQAINEFLCYYCPEYALDDLYTYNAAGTELNRTKYTETYCLSIYKDMVAPAIAKFVSGYFPITFTTAQKQSFDQTIKVIAAYFTNTIAKAGTQNYGALGTISASETIYDAIDRILFSITNKKYVEGANGGSRNVTGILPEGLLPSAYNTSKLAIDHIFGAVENLSVGYLLDFFVPNSTGDLAPSTTIVNVACYEIQRIVNVLFPGAWSRTKQSSINSFITNENLAYLLKNILSSISMDYHVRPGVRAVCTLLNLTGQQKRGDAVATLAVLSGGNYVDVNPFIRVTGSGSTVSIPEGYFIKVENQSSGIPSGYHKNGVNTTANESYDKLYKVTINSIVCESSDSTMNVSVNVAADTQINSASSGAFALSGTCPKNSVVPIKVTYTISSLNGLSQSDAMESRLYIFVGEQYSAGSLKTGDVTVTYPTKLYSSVSMLSGFQAYATADTSAGSGVYTVSAEDSVFTNLTAKGITPTATNPGQPTSANEPFQFLSASTSLKSDDIKAIAGNYTFTYSLKSKDTSVDDSSFGNVKTATVTWVLFDDCGLRSTVSKYEEMALQSSIYSSSNLWNTYQSALITGIRYLMRPELAGSTASAIQTAFEAQAQAIETAYDNLKESATASGRDLLKARIDEYDGNEAEGIRAKWTMWDVTPVSWARYSSSLSDVKDFYTKNEPSLAKIKLALDYNQTMNQRMYANDTIEAQRQQAKANLADVYNHYKDGNADGNTYDPTTYTPGSYKALTDAIVQAKQVYEDNIAISGSGEPKISDYADARSDILKALNLLTVQPLTVDDLYAEYKADVIDTDKYSDNVKFTDEAWEVYQEALAKAEQALNDPFSLIGKEEGYTEEDLAAANLLVTQYKEEFVQAVAYLDAHPYISTLVVKDGQENSGAKTYKAGDVIHAGKYSYEVTEDTIVLPYGTTRKQLTNYFTMSENVSRYTRDSLGNWTTYSSGTYKSAIGATSKGVAIKADGTKFDTGSTLTVTDSNGGETTYNVVVIASRGAASGGLANGTQTATNFKKGVTENNSPSKDVVGVIKGLLSGTGDDYSYLQALAVDFNGDGKVNVADLIMFKKWIGEGDVPAMSYVPANSLNVTAVA